MNTEKNETCVVASSINKRQKNKQNPLKRKRIDTPNVVPEPHMEKKRQKRTETKLKGVKKEEIENLFIRFYVGKLLGQGGFASVYSGYRKSDGKKVAVKFIYKRTCDKYISLPGETCSLPVEVALMKVMCRPPVCPRIIELLEWYETPRFFILVMERPDPCQDLFEYLNGEKYNENVAQKIMHQVIHAALHCHQRGVFHRDIKLENILVNPETLEVKLIDFGCGDLLNNTIYRRYSGTKEYYPPEWISEFVYKAEPATVWSLGILLYTLLCGNVPFHTKGAIVKGDLHFPDYLSDASCSLILWCLQRDPKRRPKLKQLRSHPWFHGQVCENKQLLQLECGPLEYPDLACGPLEYPDLECGPLEYPDLECGSLEYPDLECGPLEYPDLECGPLEYPDLECGPLEYPDLECGPLEYPDLECGPLEYHDLECGPLEYPYLECGPLEYHDLECRPLGYPELENGPVEHSGLGPGCFCTVPEWP